LPKRGFSIHHVLGWRYAITSFAFLTRKSAFLSLRLLVVMAEEYSVHGGDAVTTSNSCGQYSSQYCHLLTSTTLSAFHFGSASTVTTL
jgi:hypothetical protein